jgi:hypothetical protein
MEKGCLEAWHAIYFLEREALGSGTYITVAVPKQDFLDKGTQIIKGLEIPSNVSR